MPNLRWSPGAAARVAGSAFLFAAGLAAAPVGAQVRINLKAWPEPVLLDTLRQDHRLAAPPDKVYAATLVAFSDLGIPTGQTDNKKGIIGSERFEAQRTLANRPMAHWFDCGEGATTGPNANSFRLEIAVVAWIVPDGTGTTIGLAAIASGRDVSGVFRKPKECAATGALELRILERITQLVGR